MKLPFRKNKNSNPKPFHFENDKDGKYFLELKELEVSEKDVERIIKIMARKSGQKVSVIKSNLDFGEQFVEFGEDYFSNGMVERYFLGVVKKSKAIKQVEEHFSDIKLISFVVNNVKVRKTNDSYTLNIQIKGICVDK